MRLFLDTNLFAAILSDEADPRSDMQLLCDQNGFAAAVATLTYGSVHDRYRQSV